MLTRLMSRCGLKADWCWIRAGNEAVPSSRCPAGGGGEDSIPLCPPRGAPCARCEWGAWQGSVFSPRTGWGDSSPPRLGATGCVPRALEFSLPTWRGRCSPQGIKQNVGTIDLFSNSFLLFNYGCGFLSSHRTSIIFNGLVC